MLIDEIVVLPSGTELSVEAALGDLERAELVLLDYGVDDSASDLSHVRELLKLLVVPIPEPVSTGEKDRRALDKINLLLSASSWPGASGLEDVCEIVRRTGRTEVANAPEWYRH